MKSWLKSWHELGAISCAPFLPWVDIHPQNNAMKTQTQTNTKMHTPQQVAELLGVSRQRVLSLLQCGALKGVRINQRVIRITPQHLQEFIERRTK